MIQHRLLKLLYRFLMVGPVIGMVLGLAPNSASAQQDICMVADFDRSGRSTGLTIFDPATDTVLGTVPVGPGLIGDCSITQDGTLGFVTVLGGGGWVIDLTTLAPVEAPHANHILNLGEDTAITPDGKSLVVCARSALQPVKVIDVATQLERIGEVSLGPGVGCNSVDVCDDGSVLITAAEFFPGGTGVVRRFTIDGAGTLTDTGESLASPDPINVYCARGSGSGYVVRFSPGDIRSFTIPGLAPVDTRTLSGFKSFTGLINRAGDRVFVRSTFFGSSVDVFAYDSTTGALGATPLLTIPVGGPVGFVSGMEQMALSPDETKLYVPRPGGVDVFEADTGAALPSIVDANIVLPSGICCSNQPAGRVSTTKKGSLLVFSKIEIKWDAAANVTQDTFIDLTNDFPDDVVVQLYFINGDVPLEKVEVGNPPVLVERTHPGWNWVDCQITLTKDQPTYWSALTGMNSQGGVCQTFTILDPGSPPGRPDPDGPPGSRVLRGFAYAWAVNNAGEEIRWNHLKGDAAIVNYQHTTAWEYNAYAFQSNLAEHGAPIDGVPGRLLLNGFEYDNAFDKLLLDFYASGSDALSGSGATVQIDTDLTLYPVSADLRQDTHGPVHTKAVFDIWNQNEVRFSGTHRCISCWNQTLLSKYTDGQPGFPANHFMRGNLQTDKGKARIDGESSTICEENPGACDEFRDCLVRGGGFFECRHDIFDEEGMPFDCTVFDPLLGVSAKFLMFSGTASGRAYAGSNLVGQGEENARILYDIIEPPDELIIGPRDGAPIEADVADNPRINRTPTKASKRSR